MSLTVTVKSLSAASVKPLLLVPKAVKVSPELVPI